MQSVSDVPSPFTVLSLVTDIVIPDEFIVPAVPSDLLYEEVPPSHAAVVAVAASDTVAAAEAAVAAVAAINQTLLQVAGVVKKA